MKNIRFKSDILPLKDRLYRLALRITLCEAEAEDIVQDTLMRAWERRDDLSKVESVEAYLLTVCRNLALDRIERMQTQSLPLEEASHTSLRHAPPGESMEREEKLRWVHRLMEKLPEKQRTALELRDVEGKSYKEIENIMQITEEQVKVTIFRARQFIRTEFEKIENYGL